MSDSDACQAGTSPATTTTTEIPRPVAANVVEGAKLIRTPSVPNARSDKDDERTRPVLLIRRARF